jgi:NTE family protein
VSDASVPRDEAIVLDATANRGYRRSPALQERFTKAAAELLGRDGYPAGSEDRRLIADLALEGGGVKGIGLVGAILVLDEAGYRFRAVAGTSAGAIVASLITALARGRDKGSPQLTEELRANGLEAGEEMVLLKKWLEALDFNNFMPEGPFRHFFHEHCGMAADILDHVDELVKHMGLFDGQFLHTWLSPKLEICGVNTFADLQMENPEDTKVLPEGHAYTLLVHSSDITRGQLARLPWDLPNYGLERDRQSVAESVRASMSIPFFFEPVTIDAQKATVELTGPGGEKISQTWEGGAVTWVDGGMLRNFPIDAFDRIDGGQSRWPTIGIKLSAFQSNVAAAQACDNVVAQAVRCLKTMMNEWDTYEVDDTTAARTIFVDHGQGITATKFDLTQADKDLLFLNGVKAGTDFVIANAGAGVPRNAADARARLDRGELTRARPATSQSVATR